MADGRSRRAAGGATSLPEAIGFGSVSCVREVGVRGPQEALWCAGSSEVKISVCGGGWKVVSGEERAGESSMVRWKKYAAGIRGDRAGYASPPTVRNKSGQRD